MTEIIPIAVPGQLLGTADEYLPGPGTHIENEKLYASILGPIITNAPPKPTGPQKRLTKITAAPPSALPTISIQRNISAGGAKDEDGRTKVDILPEVNSTVLCRVTRITPRQASVAILVVGETVLDGEWQGLIRVQDVRATEKDKVKIFESFRPGDIVRAIVISLGDQSNYYLSTASNSLGVIMATSEAGNTMYPHSGGVGIIRKIPDFHGKGVQNLAHLSSFLSTIRIRGLSFQSGFNIFKFPVPNIYEVLRNKFEIEAWNLNTRSFGNKIIEMTELVIYPEPNTQQTYASHWHRTEDGFVLPADTNRTAYPDTVPQNILEIANCKSGQDTQNSKEITTRSGWNSRRRETWPYPSNGSETQSNASKSFHRFPQLPIELRLMIWKFSFPRSRLIEVYYEEDTNSCTTTCPAPTALKICKESRQEALRHYKLMFRTSIMPPRIYFDPSVDEFYLGIGNFSAGSESVTSLFNSLDPNDLSQIRYLAIDDDLADFHTRNDNDTPWYSFLCKIFNVPAQGGRPFIWNLYTVTLVISSSSTLFGLPTLSDSAFTSFQTDILLTEVYKIPGEIHACDSFLHRVNAMPSTPGDSRLLGQPNVYRNSSTPPTNPHILHPSSPTPANLETPGSNT
ncbi:hypothetical protein G7Y89_g14470 [Cudoniella acicularis]|uniref:S1 motif domain-containing protein n=1 Tax=Cudoniella acicularis TaxID=354080 RepID=A0A8H4R3S0_9HELO|nr:hypothetical protein G7Y89_g14470 [Cudoniella acicularis]